MEDFSSKQTTFWGALAASFWFGTALLKYLADKKANKLDKEKELKMSNVKDIKDCVVFGNEFTILCIKKLKDGFQAQDGMDLVSSLFQEGDVKKAFGEMVEGFSNVIDQAKAIDAQGGVELVMVQASYVPKIIDAFKK